MKMKFNIYLLTLVIAFFTVDSYAGATTGEVSASAAEAPSIVAVMQSEKSDSTSEKSDSTDKKSAYEKLFDKKNVQSSEGLFTLHNVEGKLYLELPLELLHKSFMLSSVVENVSNMGLSYVGQRTAKPSHLTFTKADSSMQIRYVPAPKLVENGDENIEKALERSSLPVIIHSAPILAYNIDSSAVVFDATSFFVSGSKFIGTLNSSSFGGFIQKVSKFSKPLSALKRVESYENNVSVVSDMTYTFQTYFMGMSSGANEYLTVELRSTLTLLPEAKYDRRVADYRIGTQVTDYESFNSEKQGSEPGYFANRWRVEPSDKEAYMRGEMAEPVEPIVFYIDTLFPVEWRAGIKRGILKWNKAFEEAGFKNVIEVYDYPSPSEDSLFNASNIAYNTVRYAQIPSRGIGKQVNTDPRTGEILSASVLFFRDSPITLQRERLYQTAAVEPDVRGYELPTHLMADALELAMMRETGYCLGLTTNYAASSWMDTDSLRSPSFTQREGITSSVMDVVRYNYVAQPGDIEKGVKLTADQLGVYDLYAIDWLYRLYDTDNEREILKSKIEKKSEDRRYLYGKAQHWNAYFDPRSMAEDLGNNKIAAAKYGMETLKYVAANSPEWVNKDAADESYRELFVDFIFLKIYDYYRSLMVNVGGIELNPRYEGSDKPPYIPVPGDVQRATVQYMLEQAEDMKWMDQPELLQMSGMNGKFSEYFANNLVPLLFQRMAVLAFSQTKEPVEGYSSDDSMASAYGVSENSAPYTVDEMLGDLVEFSMRNLRKGATPSAAQKAALMYTTRVLAQSADLPNVQKVKAASGRGIMASGNGNMVATNDNYFSYENVMLRCMPEVNLQEPRRFATSESAGFDAASGAYAIEAGVAFSPETDEHFVVADYLANTYETSSFETLMGISYLTREDLRPVMYKHILALRKDLDRASSRVRTTKDKSLVDYLLNSLDNAIGDE